MAEVEAFLVAYGSQERANSALRMEHRPCDAERGRIDGEGSRDPCGLDAVWHLILCGGEAVRG